MADKGGEKSACLFVQEAIGTLNLYETVAWDCVAFSLSPNEQTRLTYRRTRDELRKTLREMVPRIIRLCRDNGLMAESSSIAALPLHMAEELPTKQKVEAARVTLTKLLAFVDEENANPATKNSTQGDPPEIDLIPKYEQDAFLSWALTTQEYPALDTLEKIYDSIKNNGVEIDGKAYHPPGFETWRKYRSAGERKAKKSAE